MITLHLLKQAAELLKETDRGSVPMLQRSLSIDYATAGELLDRLIDLGLIDEDDVVRTFEVTEESQYKLELFLTQKNPEDLDELFLEAAKIVLQENRASASLIQRRMNVGYARAARLLDQLEIKELISPSDGSAKPRDVYPENIQTYIKEFKLN